MRHRATLALYFGTVFLLPVLGLAYLAWLFLDEDTGYAPNFNQARFDALGEGTSMNKILQEFDPPLAITGWNKQGRRLRLTQQKEILEYLNSDRKIGMRQTWSYSAQGDYRADWWSVGFKIGPNGKVKKKFREYATD